MQMKKRKGFTLIEMVIAVAIIGIMSTIAIPLIANYLNDAKVRQFEANCNSVEAAAVLYTARYGGTLPTVSATDGPTSELAKDIQGGWPTMPDGSTYWVTGGVVEGKVTIGSDNYTYKTGVGLQKNGAKISAGTTTSSAPSPQNT